MTRRRSVRTVQGMDGKLSAMARVPLFEGLTRRQLLHWGRRLDAAHLAPGAVVPIPARPRWLFVVLDGHALVTGDGHAQRILGPGQCCVPAAAAQGSALVALTPLTVLSASRSALGELAAQCPEVASAIRAGTPDPARRLTPGEQRDVLSRHDDLAGLAS
jgi:hypothetical protein